LIGSWVALIERERSGPARLSRYRSLQARRCLGPFWMKAEKADAGFAGINAARRTPPHFALRRQ